MGLINEFQEKNDPQFQNTLQVPQVQAPQLQQEVAPPVVSQEPQQLVNQPTPQRLQPKYAPLPENVDPSQNVDAIINARLATQYPTLTNGASIQDTRQQDDFNEWLTNTLEQRKAQAQTQNLGSLPAPNSLPSGFSQNSLRSSFGEQDFMNDGVIGNELDFKKGRFGQMGEGVLGGAFYGLNYVFGSIGTTLMDMTTDVGVAGVSYWDAASAALQGKDPVAAFQKRVTTMYNRVYGTGGDSYTAQLHKGRDFGAMGAYMTGDANDDYTKLYGASPLASAFDAAFGIDKDFRDNIQEFSGLSIARNSYAGDVSNFGRYIKDSGSGNLVVNDLTTGIISMGATAIPKFRGKLPPEQEARYQELKDKQGEQKFAFGTPFYLFDRSKETQMQRFLARQSAAFIFDTFFDLNPFDVLSRVGKKTPKVEAPQDVGKLARQERGFTMPDGVSPNEPRRPYKTQPQNILPPEPLRVTDTRIIGDLPELEPTRSINTIDVAAERVADPFGVDALPTKQRPKALGFSPERKMLPPDSAIKIDATDVSPWDVEKPLRVEMPRTVEVELDSAPLSLSGSARVDKLLAGTLEQPRGSVPVERIPDVWENVSEGQPLVTPTTPDTQVIKEKMQPLLPEAKPVVETPKVESVEAPQQVTWNPLSEKGRVKVEVSSDDSQIRRTFTSGSAQKNEMSAVNKLRDTDLIPKVLDESPSSVTYEKLPGVSLQDTGLFPEMTQLLGARVRELHDKGVIHGDLHLGNVFYDADRSALQFIDFENAATFDELGVKAPSEAADEVAFIRDEIEAAGGDIADFDRGYGKTQQAEAPQSITKQNSIVKRAINSGAAKKVDAGRIEVNNPESSKTKQLERQAVDLTSLNGEYDPRELPLLLSRAAAQPGEMTFNGKVGEINFSVRTTDQIQRFASLIPHPDGTGRPLLPPSKKQVAAFKEKYGVAHPYESYAQSRVPTKGNISSVNDLGSKNDRHKSIAHHAVENGLNYGTFYQKILDPSGSAIPDQLLEALERGAAKGEGIIIKTGRNQYAVMSTPPKVESNTPVTSSTLQAPVKNFEDVLKRYGARYDTPSDLSEIASLIQENVTKRGLKQGEFDVLDEVEEAVKQWNSGESVDLSNSTISKELSDTDIEGVNTESMKQKMTNNGIIFRGDETPKEIYVAFNEYLKSSVSNNTERVNDALRNRSIKVFDNAEDIPKVTPQDIIKAVQQSNPSEAILKTADSIIQEEKLKTTIANVEAARQEVEAFQQTTKRSGGRILAEAISKNIDTTYTPEQEAQRIENMRLSEERMRSNEGVKIGISIENNRDKARDILTDKLGRVPTEVEIDAAIEQAKKTKRMGKKSRDSSSSITLSNSGTTKAKDLLEFKQKALMGIDGWKRSKVRNVDVFYQDAAQLKELTDELRRNPVPQHIWETNKEGVVLQRSNTLGGANGVAYAKAGLMSVGKAATGTSTVLHESVHNLVGDIVGSASPADNSMWSKIAMYEPAFDTYGKTLIGEDIATASQWYVKDPDTLKVVSPLRYEAINKLYETKESATRFVSSVPSSVKDVENIAQYAAELTSLRNEKDSFRFLRLAGLDTLPMNEKLEALQAILFYDSVKEKKSFRVASSNIELDPSILSKVELQAKLKLQDVSPSVLRKVIDGKYSLKQKVYATALFIHSNPEGLKQVTAEDRAARIQQTFKDLNTLDFNAKKELVKLQQDNIKVAAGLLNEYDTTQKQNKVDMQRLNQERQKQVNADAKMKLEKYSDENLC
jgi:tRNA A-37 threonylcarbamoyl transferase component Bud32